MPTQQARRLAAILFADIAGYTAMMQRDERQALTLLQKFKQELENQVPAHHGELIQFYGDACLAVFTSSIDAVSCARSLQAAFRQAPNVPVRIGLHAGEVVFKEGNVFGDAVNIASRIESMGVPGAVLLSSSVQHQIRNKLEFKVTSLGRFQFKNVEDAMTVYALANEGLIVPDRQRITGKGKPVSKPGAGTSRKLIRTVGISFAGLLLALAIWLVISWKQNSDPAPVEDRSIAVLPFRNDSGDPGNDYFGHGIMDDILFQLQKMAELKVIASSSTMAYQDQEKSLSVIGKELDVSYLLTGSVRKSPTEVIITVQLNSTRDNRQLWVERYQKDLSLENVFDIQADIADRIARSLQTQFSQQERVQNRTLPTQSQEAYDYYLRGNEYNRVIISDNDFALRKALEMYHKAVGLDPGFALALVQISKCYEMLYWWKLDPNEEGTKEKAQTYLEKALSLNPELPEAHMIRASQLYHFDRKYEEALRILQPLRAILPNDPFVYLIMAAIYKRTSRTDEAVEMARRFIELDPFSPDIVREAEEIFKRSRHYEEALMLVQRLLQLAPENAYVHLVQLYLTAAWQPDRATEILGVSETPSSPTYYYAQYLLAIARQDYAPLDELVQKIPTDPIYTDRQIYFLKDQALAWAAWYRGQGNLVRQYAAKARTLLLEEREKHPQDYRLLLALAECYAFLEDPVTARQTLDQARAITPLETDTWDGIYPELTYLNLLILAGNDQEALNQAAYLLRIPSELSVALLQNHPLYAPLRQLPGFAAVIQGVQVK